MSPNFKTTQVVCLADGETILHITGIFPNISICSTSQILNCVAVLQLINSFAQQSPNL